LDLARIASFNIKERKIEKDKMEGEYEEPVSLVIFYFIALLVITSTIFKYYYTLFSKQNKN